MQTNRVSLFAPPQGCNPSRELISLVELKLEHTRTQSCKRLFTKQSGLHKISKTIQTELYRRLGVSLSLNTLENLKLWEKRFNRKEMLSPVT